MRGLDLNKILRAAHLTILPMLALGASSQVMAATSQAAPIALASGTAASPSPVKVMTMEDLRKKYRDSQSRFADIRGVELHYKDEGRGPAILLVHGSISTLKTWDGVASALVKAGYRVIRYDLPSFGLSGDASDEVVARTKPVDIAETLLTKLGVERVTVVGVSSGGTLGVQLAAKRPDLVERLVLSNAPSEPLWWTPTDQSTYPAAMQEAYAEEKQLGYKTPKYWDAWFDYYQGATGRYTAEFKDHIYHMMLRPQHKNILPMIAQVGDHGAAVFAMRGVKAPTLLLWGGADPLLPFSAMDTLGNYLRNTRVSKLMMPDVGHYPPMEVPERYARLVRDYIEAVEPSR
jgi:pimeloyl-ACP methyl ester carboxylesterase